MLTKDILTVPEAEILEARAAYTIVGGRVLYELEAQAAAKAP